MQKSSPPAKLSQKAPKEAHPPSAKAKPRQEKKFFPETSTNGVAYWLLASAGSVFGIVVFGGLTRLTESGLSITEWRPVTGTLPPLSPTDWALEFAKYRASPEFALLNPHMTLPEFQRIYYMEWAHRLWGRFIGISFVIPALIFVARKKVSAGMSLRLLGISGLIGFQGLLGWWMVQSGLKDELFAPGSHPRVSQYRLTAHLGAAFVCYSAMLWNGLAILRANKLLAANGALKMIARRAAPALGPFRKAVGVLAVLVFVTAMSGGLVAGLDAGMIYNSFPMMGVGLAPPSSELWDKFYSRREDGADLWWRNMLENPSTVQLDHRILATTTFAAVLSLWAYTRFNKSVRSALPKGCRRGMLGVVHLVLLQAALGISTLVYLVPTPLAAAHQAGSLALLSGVLVLGSRAWGPGRKTVEMIARRAKAAKHSGMDGLVARRPVVEQMKDGKGVKSQGVKAPGKA